MTYDPTGATAEVLEHVREQLGVDGIDEATARREAVLYTIGRTPVDDQYQPNLHEINDYGKILLLRLVQLAVEIWSAGGPDHLNPRAGPPT